MGIVGEFVPHSQGTEGMLVPESCSAHCCSMTSGGEWEMDILLVAIPALQVLPSWHNRGMLNTGRRLKMYFINEI